MKTSKKVLSVLLALVLLLGCMSVVFSAMAAADYKLTYDANGGVNPPSSQTYTSSGERTISTYQPTRTDYHFRGWSLDPDAIEAQYQPGGKIMVDSRITLYAVWYQIVDSGTFEGGIVSWTLDNNGVLTISGTGYMDWPDFDNWPWRQEYRETVKKLIIEPGISGLAEDQFRNMTALQEVSFPSTLSWVADRAFWGCTSLRSVDLPEGVNYVGEYAFRDCVSLTSITIPASVDAFDDSALNGSNSLAMIQVAPGNACLVSENNILYNLYNGKKVGLIFYPNTNTETTYSIPEGVQIIGGFAEGTQLKELWVPSTLVNQSGLVPTLRTLSLTAVWVSEDNPTYFSDANGCLFNKNQSVLLHYPRAKQDKTYVIPDTVTKIESNAIESNQIEKLVLSSNTNYLLENAFFIPSLKEIVIPRELIGIEDGVFEASDALTDVYFSGTEEEWNTIRAISGVRNDPLWRATVHFNYQYLCDVTATASPADGGTVAGAGTFHNGETVTLTATAANGWHFVGWYEGETQKTTDASYTFPVTRDVTLTAKFEQNVPEPQANLCPWCGQEHVGFFQGIIGFFHGIFAKIFGARY